MNTLLRDLARYRGFRPRGADAPPLWRLAIESVFFKAGFQAVLLYRLSFWLFERGLAWPAWMAMRFNQFLTGAEIEFSAEIGDGLLIPHPSGIVIGRGTVIGENATIYQGVTCGIRSWRDDRSASYPRIGDDVVLFARASVLGGVSIADGSVIGAHSLVTTDIPGRVARWVGR